jgi:hypothetical protein
MLVNESSEHVAALKVLGDHSSVCAVTPDVVDDRRGAGLMPWAAGTRRIEPAATRQPRRASSPWMRW